MPRKTKARRFEPRYGVSQVTLDVEADYVAREAEDCEVLAAMDLDARRTERYANCEHSWKHLTLLLEELPEQEQRIVHYLLYRDFHQLLELYLTYIRGRHPAKSSAAPRQPPKPREPNQFNEWLFGQG